MAARRGTLATDGVERLRSPRRILLVPARPFRRAQGWLGRHLSIRWKLTLWYAVIYGMTLVVIAVALPRVLQEQTSRTIDAQLAQTADRMSSVLSTVDVGPVPGQTPPECRDAVGMVRTYCASVQKRLYDNAVRVSEPGQFEQVLLYNPTGPPSTLYLTPTPQVSVYVDALTVVQVMSTGRPRYVNAFERGDFRVLVVPLHPPAQLRRIGLTGLVEVFQAETNYNRIQNALLLILAIGTPIGLAIALIVGWFLSRAALRPIGRISRTVQSIGVSGDLSGRIDFVGPRDEVGRLADTFDGMMERLENVFETQKRFVADASHELRTPLTAIRGNADLMRIAPPEERDICLTAIRREAERMSRLVGDLLLLAEADISEQPVHKVPLRLETVVEEVYRSAQVLAGDKVDIVLEPGDEVMVEADPDRIKQLLLNLVDNAVKFTSAEGTVSLRVMCDDEWARVEVSDTGVGIAPGELEAIFRRFYRVDRARATRGSGLGLAISAWIAEAHGGEIDVRSEPGKGSTFAVRLPVLSSRVTNQPTEYSAT